MVKKKIIKKRIDGNEGYIDSYAFRFLGQSWIVAKSETTWHEGGKYRRIPIFVSNFGGNIPSLFIWKIAIGYDSRGK